MLPLRQTGDPGMSGCFAGCSSFIDEALAFNDITREVISRFIEKIEVEEDGTENCFIDLRVLPVS